MILDHLIFLCKINQKPFLSNNKTTISKFLLLFCGVAIIQAATGSSEATFSAKAVLHCRASVCSDSEPWGCGSVAKVGVFSHRTNRLPSWGKCVINDCHVNIPSGCGSTAPTRYVSAPSEFRHPSMYPKNDITIQSYFSSHRTSRLPS